MTNRYWAYTVRLIAINDPRVCCCTSPRTIDWSRRGVE